MKIEEAIALPQTPETTMPFKIAAVAVLVMLCLFAMFGSNVENNIGVRAPGSFAALQSQATPAAEPPVLLVVVIGFAVGCYGTIVGIGGGPLIMPILVFFYGWENELLVATSLFIVFLNALSGCIGYARQKRIDYRGAIKFALAAMPGAFIAGYFHHFVNLKFFDIIFGIFLVALAVYTLVGTRRMDSVDHVKRSARSSKKAGFRRIRLTDAFHHRYDFYSDDKLSIKINLGLGFLCGFLGVGGGIFQVPILVFLLEYPTHLATATSHMVTLLTCAFALIPHIFLDNICYAEAMWMGLGVVVGAQVGAKVGAKLDSKLVLYLFVIILFAFAFKLFFP